MRCPRCDSKQIQRDYDDARALVSLVGLRKLLCNTCGNVFHGFDPLGKLERTPAKSDESFPYRRQFRRYRTHLPTAISLIYVNPSETKAKYSDPSKGHCDAISKAGMGLSLIGSRFAEAELSRVGRLLLVRIDLPAARIEAVVSIKNYHRIGESKKWMLGVKIEQMAEDDKANLVAYLEERANERPIVVTD
ncbi:MAG TPA: PilZ domain-containing protein [Pyrinomonadaceae bacterium]|nr:PilZ domain-containing protein [Pyrinomonadaceae bacterium]